MKEAKFLSVGVGMRLCLQLLYNACLAILHNVYTKLCTWKIYISNCKVKYGATLCLSISSGLIHRPHTQETVTVLTAERQTRWVDHQHDDDVSKRVSIAAKTKDEG